MLDKISQLIQEVATQQVVKTDGIDNNLGADIAKETGSSIMNGFQNAISNGQVSDIMGLAGNTDINALSSNPVVKNIIDGLTSKLGGSVGLNQATASGFASSVIPQILSAVFAKGKDGQAGGFNITDIISSFAGGNGGNAGGILDQLKGFGLDQNGDGKVDLNDALSALGGGNGKSGGLGDLLGGFFKK